MTAETQVTILLTFVFLIFALMWGSISSYIAKKKEYSPIIWFYVVFSLVCLV